MVGAQCLCPSRAEQLAKLGYVAFAADMYGEGKTTEHPKEAGAMSTEVRTNLKVWQGRAQAGLKILQDNKHVDARRLAAIGYCFGGSTALQLAYSGADLKAVVTFHAALPVPDETQAAAIKAKLMICHGAEDTLVPEATIEKFRAGLESAKVDYQMIYFGGAVHSFSVPGADKHNIKGIAYNVRPTGAGATCKTSLGKSSARPREKRVRAGSPADRMCRNREPETGFNWKYPWASGQGKPSGARASRPHLYNGRRAGRPPSRKLSGGDRGPCQPTWQQESGRALLRRRGLGEHWPGCQGGSQGFDQTASGPQ